MESNCFILKTEKSNNQNFEVDNELLLIIIKLKRLWYQTTILKIFLASLGALMVI